MKTLFAFGLTLMGLGSLLIAVSMTIGFGLIVLSQAQGSLELLPVSYFGGFTIAQVIPAAFVVGAVLALIGWKAVEVADEEGSAPVHGAQ